MIYDLVIVSHERDFYKIKFVLESAIKNLDFEEIHLILSDRSRYSEKEKLSKLTNKTIYYHNENDILQIDKNRVKYRPNWIYQMLLKMFQTVTKNVNFLVLESDVTINSKLNFFDGDKTIFYLGLDQNHKQYYNFNKKILNIGREYDHSFIVECMMYNKDIINDLLSKSNCHSVDDFLELIYNNVNDDCYPADYELYGNFCVKFHSDKYETRKINVYQNRQSCDYAEEKIRKFISMKNYDIISFHSYK